MQQCCFATFAISIQAIYEFEWSHRFSVRFTIIDTPGFGDWVDNTSSYQPVIKFLEDQHESFFRQESQPRRDQKTYMRVHACLYFIPYSSQGLRPLDIQATKELSKRTYLIPVVCKADTISPRAMSAFKEMPFRIIRLQYTFAPLRVKIKTLLIAILTSCRRCHSQLSGTCIDLPF